MFSSKLKRPLLGLAVTAGLFAVAGPARAEVVTNNNDPDAFTMDFGTSEALHQVGKPGYAAGAIVYNGPAGLYSGDAYDNEIGILSPVRRASGEVLMETLTFVRSPCPVKSAKPLCPYASVRRSTSVRRRAVEPDPLYSY